MEAKFYLVSVKDDAGRRVPVFEGFELEEAVAAFERHERKRITDPSEGVMFQQTWKEPPTRTQ